MAQRVCTRSMYKQLKDSKIIEETDPKTRDLTPQSQDHRPESGPPGFTGRDRPATAPRPPTGDETPYWTQSRHNDSLYEYQSGHECNNGYPSESRDETPYQVRSRHKYENRNNSPFLHEFRDETPYHVRSRYPHGSQSNSQHGRPYENDDGYPYGPTWEEYGRRPIRGMSRRMETGDAGGFYRAPRNIREAAPPVKVNLPKFNGRTKWKTFIHQFQAVTSNWREEHKLYHLLANLTEDAADFAFELEEETRQDFYYLVEELERRFKVNETPQTCARQFYRRKLRSGETLKQFAADLKALVRKAFPTGLNRWAMEQMLIKQFFDGLDDDELRYNVEYLKMPRDLDDAVDLVYEHDEFRKVRREPAKHKVLAVQGSQPNPPHNNAGGIQLLNKSSREIQELQRTLMELTSKLNSFMNVAPTNSPVNQEKKCSRCGQSGHFKRKCPNFSGPSQVKQVYAEEPDCDQREETEIGTNRSLN